MDTRRYFLQSVGSTAAVGLLAGCAGDNEEGSSNAGDLGKAATFSSDAGELIITPTELRLTDYLVYIKTDTLAQQELAADIPSYEMSDSDNDGLFLLVKLKLENSGSKPVGYPQYGLQFESTDGSVYDRVKLRDNYRDNYNFKGFPSSQAELSPDTVTEVWTAFAVPSSTTTGTMIADLELQGFLELEPATWKLRLDTIEPDTHDFDELTAGESATVGNSRVGLEFTAGELQERSGSFEYPYSGDTFTSDPPSEGKKYIFVEFSVENIGSEGIRAPSQDDMSLSGDDWETGSLSYQGDDAYNRGSRGIIDPGATKAGYVVFTAPADAEEYTFSIDATWEKEITATWQM